MPADEQSPNLIALAARIKQWGLDLGFQAVAISDLDLSQHSENLKVWLARNYHGSMRYMNEHLEFRQDPSRLVPGTVRAIMVRMDYMPPQADIVPVLKNPKLAAISRYALGRDYHRLMRKRLKQLACQIESETGPIIYRPFADSAPIMEKPLAEKAGLGWIGKHTILLNQKAGSWFFLGTLLVSLPLPIDPPVTPRCGSCHRCIDICPTGAIVGPKQLDARRCISYLTIEHKGSIDTELRGLMGNRIYGCDDCQLVCPWNRYAKTTTEPGFYARNDLKAPELLELFAWNETTFLSKTEGSAIRRIGHQSWLRNIAIALGNAPYDCNITQALKDKISSADKIVAEHCDWALKRQYASRAQTQSELGNQ